MINSGKNWFSILFLLSCVCVTSCKEEEPEAPARASGGGALNVEAFVVRSKQLAENLELPGSLLPQDETEIRSEISGRLVYLNLPEGRTVNKGTLLARIFDEELQAQLKKLQVQLTIAEKTTERLSELLKINGISQQEFDLSELEVNNLKADIDLVKVSIAKTEIRAPFNGRIGLKNISIGAYITPADMITTISKVNDLQLEFTIPEKYSNQMNPGREVKFSVSGGTELFTAKVMATASNIDASTRSLRVRALVNSNNRSLVAGGFAKVIVEMGDEMKSIIIPTQAVIPQARNKQVILYNNGEPEFRVVETGIRDSSFVQVLEGLKVGDTVLTTGLLAIRPGVKVNVIKIQ